MTLPERVFTQPGRAGDHRPAQGAGERSRSRALAVAEILGDLRSRPQLYRDDTVVFLALRVAAGASAAARRRGRDRRRSSSCCGTRRCASRTGSASLAQNELRRLQRQLQDALAKNAPDQEIDRLMSELQQALDRYLQALAAEHGAQSRPAAGSRSIRSQVLTSRDLATYARPRPRAGARTAPAIRRASCCRSCRTCWKICAWRGRGRCRSESDRGAADDARHARADAAPAAAARPQLPRPRSRPSRGRWGSPASRAGPAERQPATWATRPAAGGAAPQRWAR